MVVECVKILTRMARKRQIDDGDIDDKFLITNEVVGIRPNVPLKLLATVITPLEGERYSWGDTGMPISERTDIG